MSQFTQADLDNQTFLHYAFVVDGEVALKMPVTSINEGLNAALQSNPTIVLIPENIKDDVKFGWSYDGLTFHPPSA
jgi:hypothetical protein